MHAEELVAVGPAVYRLEAGAALCDNAEIIHLPEASHWLHHEEPDRVNRLLAEFLATDQREDLPAYPRRR